jgi:hypothetical protein
MSNATAVLSARGLIKNGAETPIAFLGLLIGFVLGSSERLLGVARFLLPNSSKKRVNLENQRISRSLTALSSTPRSAYAEASMGCTCG